MVNSNWKQCLSSLTGASIPTAGPSVSVTNQNLTSAYTYGSGGTAVTFAFVAPFTGNLTDFSFYVSTGGSSSSLSWEIRSLTNGNNTPGTTVVGGPTSIGNVAAAGYQTVTGLSVPLTQGILYWLVIYDVGTNASNFAAVRVTAGTGTPINSFFSQGYSTANGFSSAGTNSLQSACFAFKQNGIWWGGQYLDTSSTTASGAYARGNRFNSPIPMTLCGLVDTFGSAGVTSTGNIVNLYDDNGNSLWSFTFPTLAANNPLPMQKPYLLDYGSWYDIAPNTWYMFTVTPGSAQTTPRKVTGPASVPSGWLSAAMPFAGQCHYVDNNGGSFDKTQTQSMCCFGPLLVPGGNLQSCFGMAG